MLRFSEQNPDLSRQSDPAGSGGVAVARSGTGRGRPGADAASAVGPRAGEAGAEERWGEVWRMHRRWVAAVILAHMPREADLEDLLQEVALRLVRHGPALDDPAAVRGWLRTVAVNLARTAGRRRTVRRRAAVKLVTEQLARGGESTDEPTAATDVAGREEADRVMTAALALPEAYREPLVLRAVRGMSYRQIGDVLGLPVTTVETRLARARRMLREALEQGETEGGGA